VSLAQWAAVGCQPRPSAELTGRSACAEIVQTAASILARLASLPDLALRLGSVQRWARPITAHNAAQSS
jgi:hypothetical protein